MNVKRFTARTSREAFALVRQAFGEDAVVISTRPSAEGVEVTAMSPEALDQIERAADGSAAPTPSATRGRANSLAAKVDRQNGQRPGVLNRSETDPVAVARERAATSGQTDVGSDVEQLSMSTLSFQDYVRERMLKRRQAALNPETAHPEPQPQPPQAPRAEAIRVSSAARPLAAPVAPVTAARSAPTMAQRLAVPRLQEEVALPTLGESVSRRDEIDMVNELRSMKGLIEERFGALAFMEKLQREPRQALLAQKLLDIGFSPGLIRRLVDALPAQVPDEVAWATTVLERNLLTGENEPALEDQGGVYAMIGSTGVGKTTSTAKLAAAFATQYGAGNLGLVTLDAYRVGAHEQLRAYGRILGVPVHTAHDRASLEDLLELLAGKRMVLIDTAGMAQRDSRTRELLDMLSHPSISRLLVVDAAAQGETIDDVITNWRAAQCKGVVLSKVDEAVKLAPALDALIRHKLKVLGVANGQRVPEDWHRLSSNALLQRAMRGGGGATYRMEASDVQLIFAAASHAAAHPLHA